jgi:hypothetical protein
VIADSLKKFRKNEYGVGGDQQKNDQPEKKDEAHSRTISFTDDEKQALQGVEPGGDVRCEVRGTLESDGRLRIMSVTPLPGESYGNTDEQGMAGAVAQRVTPSVQLSPS